MKEEESFSEKYEKLEKIANVPNTIQSLGMIIALISNAINNHHHLVANRLIEILLLNPLSTSLVDLLMKSINKGHPYIKIKHDNAEDL
jgi:hypothetical protein